MNGDKQSPSSHGFLRIHRTWTSGDTVTVRMPFALRTEAFADNSNRFALLYGPLVLAAAVEPRKPFPVVVADEATLLASLKPVPGKPNSFLGSPEVFRVPGQDTSGPITLEPFYQAYDEHYVTYWDRLTPEQWAAKQADFKTQLAATRALEARTVDYVEVGDEQNERDHNFSGDRTDVREFNDRSWRTTDTNGWFEWDLKVTPGRAQELRVEFGGRSRSTLSVFVNGEITLGDPPDGSWSIGSAHRNLYAPSGIGEQEGQGYGEVSGARRPAGRQRCHGARRNSRSRKIKMPFPSLSARCRLFRALVERRLRFVRNR